MYTAHTQYTSRINVAAPSAITNPDLSLSNGLEASLGLLLNFVVKALILEKQGQVLEKTKSVAIPYC